MDASRKKELVEVLIHQNTSKKSIQRFRKWIVRNAKYVKDIDEEMRKFAKIPDVETNKLGCLYGIHEILTNEPKFRSYFAVGLSRSVKCFLCSLRESGKHDDIVRKLVRKWTRHFYYPEHFFLATDENKNNDVSDKIEQEDKENIEIIVVDCENNDVVSAATCLGLMSLPFVVLSVRKQQSLLTFLTICISACFFKSKRSSSESVRQQRRIRVVAPSQSSRFVDSDDRMMWNLWLSKHYLSVVTVALETGILDNLSVAKSFEELKTHTHLGSRGLTAILSVLLSLGLVNLSTYDDLWIVTNSTQRFLSKTSPWNWRDMLLGSKTETHSKLMSILRIDAENGGIGQGWEIGELTDHSASVMTSQFHAHSTNAACSFARTVISNKLSPESTHSDKYCTMLDVAGGSGCFSVQMALRCPTLYCTVFELPAVATYTRQHIDRFVSDLASCEEDEFKCDQDELSGEIRKAILDDRVKCSEGSMWWSSDQWPKPSHGTHYDAVLFSNVFHDWSFEQCERLTSSAIQVLRSGGRIYVHEIPLDDNKHEDFQLASLLSLHMLLHTSEGAQRSSSVWCSLLESVGFVDVQTVSSCAGPFCVVTGLKPSS